MVTLLVAVLVGVSWYYYPTVTYKLFYEDKIKETCMEVVE